jgi:nucleoside-diphosphate-sugar epimerase
MRFAVVGANGFIGSAVVRDLKRRTIVPLEVNSPTELSSIGSIDVLIDANGNSRKYVATDDPSLDFNLSVMSVLDRLLKLRPVTYVYLSSGEVYGDNQTPETTIEDNLPATLVRSNYGLNRYISELFVSHYSVRSFIVRLGGFVGYGLKKNPVFDIINNKPLRVSPESRFQFIDVDYAAKIIIDLANEGRPGTYNLTSAGTIRLDEIFSALQIECPKNLNHLPQEYHELNVEKIQRELKLSLPTTHQVITDFLNRSLLTDIQNHLDAT